MSFLWSRRKNRDAELNLCMEASYLVMRIDRLITNHMELFDTNHAETFHTDQPLHYAYRYVNWQERLTYYRELRGRAIRRLLRRQQKYGGR